MIKRKRVTGVVLIVRLEKGKDRDFRKGMGNQKKLGGGSG